MATPGIRDGDDVSKLFIFDTRLGPTEETEHEKVRARMRGCAARDAVPNSHILHARSPCDGFINAPRRFSSTTRHQRRWTRSSQMLGACPHRAQAPPFVCGSGCEAVAQRKRRPENGVDACRGRWREPRGVCWEGKTWERMCLARM